MSKLLQIVETTQQNKLNCSVLSLNDGCGKTSCDCKTCHMALYFPIQLNGIREAYAAFTTAITSEVLSDGGDRQEAMSCALYNALSHVKPGDVVMVITDQEGHTNGFDGNYRETGCINPAKCGCGGDLAALATMFAKKGVVVNFAVTRRVFLLCKEFQVVAAIFAIATKGQIIALPDLAQECSTNDDSRSIQGLAELLACQIKKQPDLCQQPSDVFVLRDWSPAILKMLKTCKDNASFELYCEQLAIAAEQLKDIEPELVTEVSVSTVLSSLLPEEKKQLEEELQQILAGLTLDDVHEPETVKTSTEKLSSCIDRRYRKRKSRGPPLELTLNKTYQRFQHAYTWKKYNRQIRQITDSDSE